MTRLRSALLFWLLLLVACGPPGGGRSDAGDAGPPRDAGRDAGSPGEVDAGARDAGTPDAGTTDAGATDAGGQDAGQTLRLGWGNLQYPPLITSAPGGKTTVYGQLWIDGRTQQPGATAGVIAELGFGPVGSDPADAGWSWVAGAFNVDTGNNDEFKAELTAPAGGTYDYAWRYSAGGAPLYGDRSDQGRLGSTDGYQSDNAGKLAVRAPGGALRVGTLNLHCINDDPQARIDVAAARFAQLGVEALVLQEVCVHPTLGNTGDYLAARLTTLMGARWRAFFAQSHLANGTTPEGVAVLTSLPVVATAVKDLPTRSFPRKAQLVLVGSPLGLTAVTAVHFSFEGTPNGAADRLDQANAVLTFVNGFSQASAAVVGGDLNSIPTEGPAGVFTGGGFADGWAQARPGEEGATHSTFSTTGPTRRIDYLFVRGAQTAEATVEFAQPYAAGAHVSDHCGVAARLAVP